MGADTTLALIVKLVQQAQNSKAPSQRLADRASQWLVIAAITVALATFIIWYTSYQKDNQYLQEYNQ